MNPSYAWVCHSCSATNLPGQGACSACHFPAIASAREIKYARSQVDTVSPSGPIKSEPDLIDEISTLPTAQQAAAIFLLGLCFAGLVMFRALSSFEGTVGGLVVSVVAGTLLVFLLKKTGK